MPLSDHLPPAAPKGPPCTVGTTLANLDRDDRHTLNNWLHDRAVSDARIATALVAATGDGPGASAISRHRRGLCRCNRAVTFRG